LKKKILILKLDGIELVMNQCKRKVDWERKVNPIIWEWNRKRLGGKSRDEKWNLSYHERKERKIWKSALNLALTHKHKILITTAFYDFLFLRLLELRMIHSDQISFLKLLISEETHTEKIVIISP